MNYVDHDGSKAVADSACGPRSYDGHKGTDFAVRDLAQMQRGVDVRAIATGTVLRLRNNIAEHGLSFSAEKIKGRECGNGIVIRHAGGWESQYCHLRRGSIWVTQGDVVARGEAIGRVGMSGRTAFPYLHLALRKDGQIVDPVNGRRQGQGCGLPGKPLFKSVANVRYQHSRLYAAGFAPAMPSGAGIKTNAASPPVIKRNAKALVFWAALFSVAKGSTLQLTIKMPDGSDFITKDIAITRNQAWRMVYIGRKRRVGKSWPPGRYRGVAKLLSGTDTDKTPQTQQISVDTP